MVHRLSNEPGPPAWQARILPLNQPELSDAGQKKHYLDHNMTAEKDDSPDCKALPANLLHHLYEYEPGAECSVLEQGGYPLIV